MRFNQLNPFVFQEFFGGFENIGNPNLKNSNNHNIDLKFENYLKPGELFAVTVFGKQINSPIERILEGGTIYTYTNTKRALVAGLELEGNLNLANYSKSTSAFSKMKIGGNVSYLYSAIEAENNTDHDQSQR